MATSPKKEQQKSTASEQIENPTDEVQVNIENNPKDLDWKVVNTPKFVQRDFDFDQTSIAQTLISKAEDIVKEVRKNLGHNLVKPTSPSVNHLFNQVMGKEEQKDYLPVVDSLKTHIPGSLNTLLKAKYEYEKTTHKTKADHSLTSLKAGNGIETALINWELAVSTYEEAKQNYEAEFREAVYSANYKDRIAINKDGTNLEDIISNHVNFNFFAVIAANAVSEFGKNMKKATDDLASAFSKLITDLVKNWNDAFGGEAKRISSKHEASKLLWLTIQQVYPK